MGGYSEVWVIHLKQIDGCFHRLSLSKQMEIYFCRKESVVKALGGVIRVGILGLQYGFAIPVMTALIFTAYTGTGGTLTPRRVFTVLALVAFVRLVLIDCLTRCLILLSECWVAVSRIQVSFI